MSLTHRHIDFSLLPLSRLVTMGSKTSRATFDLLDSVPELHCLVGRPLVSLLVATEGYPGASRQALPLLLIVSLSVSFPGGNPYFTTDVLSNVNSSTVLVLVGKSGVCPLYHVQGKVHPGFAFFSYDTAIGYQVVIPGFHSLFPHLVEFTRALSFKPGDTGDEALYPETN